MLLEDIEQKSRDEGIAQWDPTFPLSSALVPDPLVTNPDELAFGSFFVFRKLEQNVRADLPEAESVAAFLTDVPVIGQGAANPRRQRTRTSGTTTRRAPRRSTSRAS